MYTYMRLTHIHMWYLLTLYLYNQSDGLRLSEQLFTRNLLLYKYIFIYKLNYCNATLRCSAAIYYAALYLFLYCIIIVSYFVVKCDFS